MLEKDFNLQTSKYIYNRLKELGVPVALTRDDDTTLTRQERIDAMTNTFGNSPDVIVLSNHINAGGGEGAEVVYALRNNDTLAKNILNEIGKAGQVTRSYYQRRLPSDPSKDYYYIMRETGNVTPLLIEYGFIDNSNDIYKLQNNILDYAEGVVKAVTDYIGVPYVSPFGEENVYIVQKGDSLYSIANKYGITIDALKAANNITSNLLQVGQKLVIPTTTPEVSPPSDYLVYTVVKGDSLWNIADKYNTTVMDIVELNQLGTSTLKIGQQLLIPNTDNSVEEENVYIVEKGDSLWSIANKYNINVSDLIELNNLENNILQVGDKLLIPSENEVVEEPSKEQTIEYVVQRGDNLWNLASKYSTTVNEIKSLNNLNTNVLQPGQLLLIPNTEEYVTYYVKKNDNLWNIARDYNTSVDNIKKLNNLISDDLKIGQVLILPN